MLDRLKKLLRPAEVRSSGAGYTAEVIASREAYISGRRGIAELTATAQSCVTLWESAFSIADVDGTVFLDKSTMSLIARTVALRGEFVAHITGDGLHPATDWDVSTRGGRPRAYRLSLPEAGGGRTQTALADEVLHLRLGTDVSHPWTGTAPLRRAQLTAGLLHAVETALAETYENAPVGSQLLPLPEGTADDMASMRAALRGRRGTVMMVEGAAAAVAAGMHPSAGQKREDLTPDLAKAIPAEALAAARDAILSSFGVLPSLFNRAATGPAIRESQRHLALWMLQPLAELLAEEATVKLGAPVRIDVMRPLQAFDAGGRARALSALVQTMAAAKEAGIAPADLAAAMHLVDWKD
jgi:hypothetical protein